jgi:hypothetical protein
MREHTRMRSDASRKRWKRSHQPTQIFVPTIESSDMRMGAKLMSPKNDVRKRSMEKECAPSGDRVAIPR